MTKDEFGGLFRKVLVAAVENAEQRLGANLPEALLIDMHTARPPFDPINVETALDRLGVDDNRFRWVIDVAVVAYSTESTFVFVRPSDHQPGPLEITMMYPSTETPFQR